MLSLEREIKYYLSNISVASQESEGLSVELDTTNVRAQVDISQQGCYHNWVPRTTESHSLHIFLAAQ